MLTEEKDEADSRRSQSSMRVRKIFNPLKAENGGALFDC